MDKKNTLIGISLLVLAFGLMFYQSRQAEEQWRDRTGEQQQRRQLAEDRTETGERVEDAATPVRAPADREQDAPRMFEAVEEGGLFQPAVGEAERVVDTVLTAVEEEADSSAGEETFVLQNDHIRATFTNRGGALKHVALIHRNADGNLTYPARIDSDTPYLFNAGAESPALAISLDVGPGGEPADFAPIYRVVHQSKNRLGFEFTTPEGGVIRRGYEVQESGNGREPYLILHETRFVNQSETSFNLSRLFINVGTAPPTRGDLWGEYLNFGYFNGDRARFIKMSRFTGRSGFLGIGSRLPVDYVRERVDPLIWGSVKNQFFAAVLTPEEPGTGIHSKPVHLGESIEDPDLREGLTGSVEFDLGRIAPGEERRLAMSYYVGPKEYRRLAHMGQQQDRVMQFGFLAGISKFLLVIMLWIHGIVVHVAPTWGWGLTIVIFTIIIKTVLWPLTQVQVKSAKRMAKIQKPMQELREKFKDNPQKMQAETLKLFKQHRVNPAAGCLPLLIQLPIFIALFFMLRTASELRFAPFLWIQDLSVSDTVATIGGFPINPLPVMMAVTMFFQMRMTPTPTTDNLQRKIFQLMPFIFLIFCYRFPSGLVLYWTCQNLISILQQWLANRRPDDPEPLPVEESPAPVKNKPAATAGQRKSTGRRRKK